MTDNVELNPASGGVQIASDEIGGHHYQRIKPTFGPDGVANDVWQYNPLPVAIGGLQADAFGRMRVANPITLFDSKQINDNQPLFWDDQEVSGGGTGSTHSVAAARSRLTVSNTTAGKRVRQTFMRFNYQTGKSHLVMMTAKMDTPQAGISAAVGYFDDDNGLFFKMDGTTLKAVQRSSVSGSAVDTEVTQETCNGDALDGTGPSGITIDPTKTQIMWFDMEWLGVGVTRCGFVIDGAYHLFHTFLNTNTIDVVYMSTPNLPLRYEIENDGTGGASHLDHICSTVISEGGNEGTTGAVFSTNMGATFVNANTAGTYYALIGLRLKTTHLGARAVVLGQTVQAVSNDNFLWELRFNPTVAGTFTYGDVTNSALQVAKGDVAGNPSTNTVTGGEVIASGYGSANSTAAAVAGAVRHLGAAIDDTRDELVLCVTPMTSNADLRGSLTWREVA